MIPVAMVSMIVVLSALDGDAVAKSVRVSDGRLTVSEQELRGRVANYLGTIDVPVTADDWRALGRDAIPILEEVVSNPDELPSRRAAAVGGLAAIGGTRARELLIRAARSGHEPFVVTAAALRGTPQVLTARELRRELMPILRGAPELEIRVTAAEVLARNARAAACPTIRALVDQEDAPRLFTRAIAACHAQAP